MGRRPGTEKRQRTHMFTVRFSPQEADRARHLADRAGQSVAALIRQSLFNVPPPRAVRRPTVNHKAVAQLLGQLGKIGTNINQLAKQANAGRYQENTIELALRDLMELRTACLQALGREPDRPLDDSL
ncbi:MAG: MobC family plasmid mobilization relaxosome protein [Nitrospira sp.]|nr:MobC family plasmid mobilization relaxosome protein [Nitrospira sp.]